MPRLAWENSLVAFELALQLGADGIELDVHATSDEVVVVRHDPVLENGLVIADETLDTLRAAGRSRSRLPELDDVCRLVDGRAELFVEIKGVGIEQLVVDVMRRCNGPFAIHSFDHPLIARIHAIDPTIRLGVLFESAPADVRALMSVTGARDVWPQHALVSQRLVDDVHDAGGRVIAWTVNEPADVERLTRLGVDGLCGDDVRLFPTS